jgi:serine/threonine protein kinase
MEGRIGNYILVRELGEGAFSKVWLGKERGSEKLYAIKIMSLGY